MWFSGTCLNMCCVDSSFFFCFIGCLLSTMTSTLWHRHYDIIMAWSYVKHIPHALLCHTSGMLSSFSSSTFFGGVMCENREFHLFSFVVVVTLMLLCSVIRNEPVRDSWAPCCYTTAWQELRCLNKSRPFSLFRSLLSYWLNILIRPHQALLLRGPWKSPINHP